MIGNRRRDTRPEVALRRELHHRGLRYRVDYSPLPGLRCRVDLAFTRARVAVFVDGCFWHSCPEHGTRPRTNSDYWEAKLALNRARDARNNEALGVSGWRVVRVWEHEDRKAAADRIFDALTAAGRGQR